MDVVLGRRWVRERGSRIWHKPQSWKGSYCGVVIREREDILFEEANLPSDDELCGQCAELFGADARRRLGQVYALLLELAARRRDRSAGGAE